MNAPVKPPDAVSLAAQTEQLIESAQHAQRHAPQAPNPVRNARRQYALAITSLEEARLRLLEAHRCAAAHQTPVPAAAA